MFVWFCGCAFAACSLLFAVWCLLMCRGLLFCVIVCSLPLFVAVVYCCCCLVSLIVVVVCFCCCWCLFLVFGAVTCCLFVVVVCLLLLLRVACCCGLNVVAVDCWLL